LVPANTADGARGRAAGWKKNGARDCVWSPARAQSVAANLPPARNRHFPKKNPKWTTILL